MGCSGCGGSAGKTYDSSDPNTRVASHHKFPKRKTKVNPIDRFAVFSLGNLKDFIVFTELLNETKQTIEDVKAFIAATESQDKVENDAADYVMKQSVFFMNSKPRCPECNNHVGAQQVNTMPCNVVDVDMRGKWLIYCVEEMECGWSHVIDQDLIHFIQEHKRKNLNTLKDIIKKNGG